MQHIGLVLPDLNKDLSKKFTCTNERNLQDYQWYVALITDIEKFFILRENAQNFRNFQRANSKIRNRNNIK